MKAILITLLLFLSTAASYRDPTMAVPDQVEVRTGETAHIEVILEHTQTTMWNVKVYVDTEQIDATYLKYLEITQDKEHPYHFEKEIPFGTEAPATLDIKVAETSPSMQVKIPIIAAGSKGPCMKGCEPFLIQKSVTLQIKRQDPKLALMLPEPKFEVHSGEVITTEIQLRNYGAAAAYVTSLVAVSEDNVLLQMQTVPSQIEPGITESVGLTIFTKDLPPGTYLISVNLVYKDSIKNTFQESKTLYIIVLQESESPPPSPVLTTTPPSQPVTESQPLEEKYSYFLAGMFTGACSFGVAVMFGLFLKKHRPTK